MMIHTCHTFKYHPYLLLSVTIKLKVYTLVLSSYFSVIFSSSFFSCYYSLWRCSWTNNYYCRKWTQQTKFKLWTRLFTFHMVLIHLGKVWMVLIHLGKVWMVLIHLGKVWMVLIHLGKVWIQLFSNWTLSCCYGNQSRKKKTEFKPIFFLFYCELYWKTLNSRGPTVTESFPCGTRIWRWHQHISITKLVLVVPLLMPFPENISCNVCYCQR